MRLASMKEAGETTRSRWLGPPFRGPAERLVSLVPSLTHAVFDLGAGKIVAGRTDFCVKPAKEAERVPAVGGTKNPDVEKIFALEPDAVLANREENTRPRIERLAERVLTDPGSPLDIPVLWRELGTVCGRAPEAERRARELEAEIGRIEAGTPRSSSPRFVYWIWRDPWMAAGPDTYVSRLLTMAGWVNTVPPGSARYPRVDPADAARANTTLLFATEPYPFELPRDLDAFPGASVEESGGRWRLEPGTTALTVDGQVMSWYPSLTLEGLRGATHLRESMEAVR
jgi:iron complex transport system substrate-binding protein